MSDNGNLRSQILDASGERAATCTMEAPGGSSPYFGWMGDHGFAMLRVEDIQCLTPITGVIGMYKIFTKYGLNVDINGLDARRLLKRMGWTEARRVTGAAQ